MLDGQMLWKLGKWSEREMEGHGEGEGEGEVKEWKGRI